MTETQMNLNVHEIGILLSALQNLELADEIHIARDYGSAPALYNKLYSYYEQMDQSMVELRYELTPSF
jgi:nitrogen-specific signal transduction histidine kinase